MYCHPAVKSPMAAISLCFVLFMASNVCAQIISVEPMTIRFGEMNQRETQVKTITITNNGAGRLVLGEVEADCGCTVPSLEKNSLSPGESTTLEVQFNSKNFNGNVVKMITVHSNDPSTPKVEVMISATIMASVLIDPSNRRVTFKRSAQGLVQVMPITFTSVGQNPLEVTAPATSNKGLFHLKAINGKDGNPLVSVVEVTIPANAPVGANQDMARIRTNAPGMESVDFYFKSWILSELTLDIEAVKFRFKKNLNQTITITPTKDSTKFMVTGVEIDMPEISVSYENTKKGEEATIHLEGKVIDKTDIRAIKAKGRMKGTLLIHTDLESLPTIEVPVSYMLRM